MISFSTSEILLSLGYAAGYGVAYSAIYSLLSLVRAIIFSSSGIIGAVFDYEKIFPLPSFKKIIDPRQKGALFSFFSVLLFTLGFIVISYFALDGTIRAYMLLLAFASFYLSKFVLFDFLSKFLLLFFDCLLRLVCIALRGILLPFRYIFIRIKNK